ncbi:MAG: hypothetical protein COA44_05855 [Arcobacter sp.]|nr:MAG: hypothetical protein COA44_05855 [Arcobacter sp.]
MNSFNPQSLKKLLIVLGISIFIIIIFLILKVFLQEEKNIELKSFKKNKIEKASQTEVQKVQKNKEQRFLLLPAK